MSSDWSHFRTRWTGVLLGLIACGSALLLQVTPVVSALERDMYDRRVEWLSQWRPATDQIVLITLDDQSLARFKSTLGRWPWPRAVFASVLDYCADAKVAGFDFLFSEPDWQWPERDQMFAEEVGRHGRVVLPIYLQKREADADQLHPRIRSLAMSPSLVSAANLPQYRDVLPPFDSLLEQAAAVGQVIHDPDADGVARSYMTVTECLGRYFPSLALAMLRLGEAGDQAFQLRPGRLEMSGRSLALTGSGRMRLDYTDCRYRQYSIGDVLASWQQDAGGEKPQISREVFRDKYVLIGSTATGLEDDREVTPVSRELPGMLIHAVALDNLLQGTSIRTVPRLALVICVLLLTLIPAFSGFASPRPMALLGTFLMLLFLAAAIGLFFAFRVMVPVSTPVLGLVLSTGSLSLLYWYRERSQRTALEQLEASKQAFTDMLVHDLKNRVSGITMGLSMLSRKISSEDASAGKMLATAQASGARMLDQVNALLDIRKMEEGKMALAPVRMSAADVLADCAREYRAAAGSVDVQLVAEGEPGRAPFVSVDPAIFSRILGNLVWNALQYAKRGSDVRLFSRSAAESKRVELIVANQGRNIPPDKQEQVFELFASGSEEKRQGTGHGTGLGLAFCRLASEAHGGDIRIQSPWEEGRDGVQVIITLPLVPDAAS